MYDFYIFKAYGISCFFYIDYITDVSKEELQAKIAKLEEENAGKLWIHVFTGIVNVPEMGSRFEKHDNWINDDTFSTLTRYSVFKSQN